MKTTLLATAVLATLTLTACGANKPTSFNSSVDLASIRAGVENGSETPQEAAEEIALAAEQLAQSANFPYVANVANEALALDPNNSRAKFWKAVSGPIMQMKGLATRVEPLAKKNTARYRAYVSARDELKSSLPMKGLRDFAFKGKKDIESEVQIQETISRVTLKLDELRKTLKELRGQELTINMTPEMLEGDLSLEDAQKLCEVAHPSQDVYDFKNCDFSRKLEVKLNDADLEMIQQAVAGVQVYVGIMNSYSLEGVIAESEKDSSEDPFARLVKNPKFGTLRDGRTLAVLPEIAADASLAIRSALALQAELCGNDTEGNWKREGYALSSGSCAMPESGVEVAMQTLELLSKQATPVAFMVNGVSKTATVDMVSFSKKPVQDLRTLIPTAVDACGNTTNIGDKTVAGLFPNGDVLEVFASESGNCR